MDSVITSDRFQFVHVNVEYAHRVLYLNILNEYVGLPPFAASVTNGLGVMPKRQVMHLFSSGLLAFFDYFSCNLLVL